MEKMRNKKGQIISYREKVYIDGKAVTKTFKRKSDALAWKQNFGAEVRRKKALGIAHIQSINFDAFVKEWMEMKQGQGMAWSTMKNYRSAINHYLLPIVGKTKLEHISLGMAQKVIQKGREKGISAERTNKNLVVFSQMLGDAVKLNYLVRNPLTGMKKVTVQPKSIAFWMPEQVRDFLAAAKDKPFYFVYALALNTGMRKAELFGLCWDKVNLAERRIEISRIRTYGEGLKETTKTKAIRHLPLNDAAFKILSELSRNKRHQHFVFVNENGTPPSVNHAAGRGFKRAMESAEVPKIRFHDLRTTYASNFVMAGGDIFRTFQVVGSLQSGDDGESIRGPSSPFYEGSCPDSAV